MNEPKKKILLTAQANEFIYAQPLPVIGNLIYILSGFIKKTQKTPVHEIRKARQIMKGLGL